MTAHTKPHRPLAAAELERRRKAFDDCVALCSFEGIEFTDEMKADAQRLLNGEMTHEQYTAYIIAKYKALDAAKR